MTTHLTDQPTTPDPDEQLLREVLDSAMAHTRPPATLAGDAISLGRRQRTRRRITIASGAVAASVLAAVAVPWLLGGSAENGRSDTGADFASEPTPTPSLPIAPAGWWDMPAVEMVSTVEAILPDSVTVTAPGPLTADTPEGGHGAGFINSVVTGPGGAGRLNVMLYPDPPESITFTCGAQKHSDATSCTQVQGGEELTVAQDANDSRISCAAEFTGNTQCTQITTQDGTIIGRRLVNRSGDVETVEVVLRRKGGTIYAAAANTLDEKWGAQSPASAEIPPMTLDQLEALVRNEAWTSYRP